MYKFKQKKDSFCWQNEKIKLKFSSPNIELSNSTSFIYDESEIMYFYYTVSIYRKKITNKKKKWKLVIKKYIYDFPNILQLKAILKEHLNRTRPLEDGQKNTYLDGDVRYQFTDRTEGIAFEDFYELTSEIDSETFKTFYEFYMGCSFDMEGDINSIGIKICNLKEQDLQNLLHCVESFINYAMNLYNETFKNYIVLNSKNKQIINDKVYKYNDEKLEELEEVFKIGDIIDISIYSKNKDKINVLTYKNVKIIDVREKQQEIIIKEGEFSKSFNIHSITEIDREPTLKELQYDIQEVAEDFYLLLNENEKKEFKICSLDYLLYKYKHSIINRTWLCRNEHSFSNDYKNTGYPETDIEPIIKQIIKKIQLKITKDR